jgi:hypothetical protein
MLGTEGIREAPAWKLEMAMHEIAFHVRREAEERRRAAATQDPLIADIHSHLADRHADKAWSIAEHLSDQGVLPPDEDEPARTRRMEQPRRRIDGKGDKRQTRTEPPRPH